MTRPVNLPVELVASSAPVTAIASSEAGVKNAADPGRSSWGRFSTGVSNVSEIIGTSSTSVAVLLIQAAMREIL
jgi:hypothetical protein